MRIAGPIRSRKEGGPRRPDVVEEGLPLAPEVLGGHPNLGERLGCSRRERGDSDGKRFLLCVRLVRSYAAWSVYSYG